MSCMEGYIYKIKNKITDKIYIGSTLDFKKRKQSHLNALQNGNHHSYHLQNSYNKFGKDAFEFFFKKIEVESEEELRKIEERYINFCWASAKLYNVSKKGSGGDLISYHPKYDEIKLKISNGLKKRYENLTEEDFKKISERVSGEKNPNYGKKWTNDQRKHLSEYRKTHPRTYTTKGKKLEDLVGEERASEIKKRLSECAKKKTGSKNPFYGKSHTEETKEKLRKAKLGKKNISCSKKVIFNGIVYESVADCGKKLNIPYGTVAYRARNGIYGFAYVGETEGKQRTASKRWTPTDCENIAKTCDTLKEFFKKSPSACNYARNNGLLDEFKQKYFKELRHKWTIEEILVLCDKYNSYTELRNSDKKIASILSRNKLWRNEVKEFYKNKI